MEGGALRERHDPVEGSVGGRELSEGGDGLGEAVVAVGPLVGLEARRRSAEPPTAGVDLFVRRMMNTLFVRHRKIAMKQFQICQKS